MFLEEISKISAPKAGAWQRPGSLENDLGAANTKKEVRAEGCEHKGDLIPGLPGQTGDLGTEAEGMPACRGCCPARTIGFNDNI